MTETEREGERLRKSSLRWREACEMGMVGL